MRIIIFQECVYIYDSLNSIENKNKILNQEGSFNLEKKTPKLVSTKIGRKPKNKNLYLIIFLNFNCRHCSINILSKSSRQKTNKKLQLLNTELDQTNRIKTRFLGF